MTKTRDLSDFLIEGGADLPLGKPHIVPDVLYPSYVASGTSNKLLDGTTDHSGAFGTEQSDGRKYYYTNIAGSKPIKDPRIGAHFGSQRYMFKSIQQLEQETATHGDEVYSIDGREWMRGVGSLTFVNNQHGIQVQLEGVTTSFYEITGYFNAFNFINFTSDSARNLKVELDGVTAHATFNPNGSVNSPLGSRYVPAGSVINVDLTASGSSLSSDTTLGIHTIRISWVSGTNYPQGCELIAQDTSNRNNIQIPSQNVVSFGKKFTVSGTPHYDPFNGFTSGSSVSSYVDTATSLGLDKWLHSSNYYRPYNGGRVVKWVDSSGVIKTSVTLMPPNAKSIGDSSSLTNATAKANASVANNTFYPTFEAHTTDVNEDNLHEVAKTFHWREFGNGSANEGTLGANYADASMLNTTDDIAYAMDDGLTSLSSHGFQNHNNHGLIRSAYDDTLFITFIGTGLSVIGEDGVGSKRFTTVAQNLPYGTHIFKVETSSSDTALGKWILDGIEVKTDFSTSNWDQIYAWGIQDDITFHQPKRPPIPADACVLADYMLMADFVVHAGGEELVSKGTRVVSTSRDHFYDCVSTTISLTQQISQPNGFKVTSSVSGSGDSATMKLPYFGTDFVINHYADRSGEITENFNSDVGTASVINSSAHDGASKHIGNNLGLNELKVYNAETNAFADELYVFSTEIATPIHTSSHYQTFETPFLHELVGGDRNMEQTNLVVSPDGKTWDEVTRDTSYITVHTGMQCGGTPAGTSPTVNTNEILFKHYQVYRGSTIAIEGLQKNFVLAYDRIICLEDGDYICSYGARAQSGLEFQMYLNKNGSTFFTSIDSNYHNGDRTGTFRTVSFRLKRGDYLDVQTGAGLKADTNGHYASFQIIKV